MLPLSFTLLGNNNNNKKKGTCIGSSVICREMTLDFVPATVMNWASLRKDAMYSWLQALEMKVAKVRPRNIQAVETSDVNTRSSVSVLTSWLKAADFMVKSECFVLIKCSLKVHGRLPTRPLVSNVQLLSVHICTITELVRANFTAFVPLPSPHYKVQEMDNLSQVMMLCQLGECGVQREGLGSSDPV